MIFHVTDRTDRLKNQMVRLMLEALDCAPSEVWLITPWLKNVEFDVRSLGPYRSVFGTHRERITLKDLLRLLGQKHLIHVIVKPPHELVPLPALAEYQLTAEQVRRVQANEDLDFDLQDEVMRGLRERSAELKREFLNHADTVLFAEELAHLGAQVSYRDALHAKLLWLPSGALFGSANFTNGGLAYNAELVAEVRSDEPLEGLRVAAEDFQAHSWPRDQYDLTDRDMVPKKRTLPSADFFALANHPSVATEVAFKPLLDALAGFYR